jgi:hypothetical protein
MAPEGHEDDGERHENDRARHESDDPGRPLTIDDVPRLGSGTGIAIGCAAIVIAAIVAFWLIRGIAMHG